MSDRSILHDPPRIHLRTWLLATGDPLRDLALIDRGFAQCATEPPQRTAQVVTSSAALRQMLTRCLLTLDLVVTDTTERHNLVLLDLDSPDALTHCQALRRRDLHLPILVLVTLAADQQCAWEVGANAVLSIPFDMLELHTCIRRLLQLAPSNSPAGGPLRR